MTAHKDLRAIAEAATPGPWRVFEWDFRGRWQRAISRVSNAEIILPFPKYAAADAAHIAAWSPDRALAALDVIEAVTDLLSVHFVTEIDNYPLREALDRWEALP